MTEFDFKECRFCQRMVAKTATECPYCQKTFLHKKTRGFHEVLSEAGNECNQDRARILVRDEYTLLVIADGAGGRSGGTEAAEAFVDCASKTPVPSREARSPVYWCSMIRDIDLYINRANHGGETTAVVAAIHDKTVCGASVGDSCAWLIHNGDHHDLTVDQIRKPMVGSGMARAIAFGATRLTGTLLLATDGLAKYTSPQRIVDTVELLGEQAAPALIDLVRLRSGKLHDDTSLILFHPG